MHVKVPMKREVAKRKLTITFHIFLVLILVDVNTDIDPVLGYRGFGILISHDVSCFDLRCGWLAFGLV